MKPYFRKKGHYKDGRIRIVIEWLDGKDVKSRALPKPEKLLKILDRQKLMKSSFEIRKNKGQEKGVN